MNRIMKSILAVFIASSLTACTKLKQGSNRDVLKNAFVLCDTLQEAMKLAGMDEMAYPASIEGYSEPVFSANENGVIQVDFYTKEDNSDDAITLRKANVEDEDLSEDYTDYEWLETYSFLNEDGEEECIVTMQGHDKDRLSKATWSYDGYSYSIVASSGYKDMETIVAQSTALHGLQSKKEGSSMMIANPFVTCDTAEDAIELAGFDMQFPPSIDGYDEPVFQAVKDTMIQGGYYFDDGSDITIRKSNVQNEDISGDYNEYSWTSEFSYLNGDWDDYDTAECMVTLFGFDNEYRTDSEEVHKAIWSHGGYSYSITSSKGIIGEGIYDLIRQVD